MAIPYMQLHKESHHVSLKFLTVIIISYIDLIMICIESSGRVFSVGTVTGITVVVITVQFFVIVVLAVLYRRSIISRVSEK